VVLAAILLPALAGGAARAETVPAILQQQGLRAIDPAVPAMDFQLPTLAGGRATLSDFQGRWVVLTFFATWCGPCRMEMPTLEKLHRQYGPEGAVAVVTVSVDDSLDPVGPYIQKGGFTFPVLWDARGQAARAYKAQSIPMTVLIDPQGRMNAISRGARDWSALKPMLDRLVAAVPGDPTAQGTAYAAQPLGEGDSAESTLPPVLNPPTAQVSVSNPNPRPGEPFELHIQMQWAGSFEEYLPHPPELFLPEGVEEGFLTASTNSGDGRNQVTYSVSLTIPKAGRYALDPVELRYTPRLEGEMLASRIEGPTVEVLTTGPSTTALALGGGASLAALGLVGFLVWRRRQSAADSAAISPEAERRQRLQALYQEARRQRLEGDAAGCFERLARIHQELTQELTQQGTPASGEPTLADDPAFQAALDRARYGGQAPPRAELDGWERRIERALKDLQPDPLRDRRRTLDLQEKTSG
jgi:peroxiredoxin